MSNGAFGMVRPTFPMLKLQSTEVFKFSSHHARRELSSKYLKSYIHTEYSLMNGSTI